MISTMETLQVATPKIQCNNSTVKEGGPWLSKNFRGESDRLLIYRLRVDLHCIPH